jgi:RNA polymerase sigma-70 factor (ECF subfamily)
VSQGVHSQGADRARFEQIYAQTRQPVLAYLLRRTGNTDDAADLLSEVYLVAWRRIDNLPVGDDARLWLFGVTRRLLANQRRRTQTGAELAAALKQTLAVERPQLLPAERESDGGVLLALAQLSAADRELLLLSGWEELTPTEIATVIGRPASIVRVRLHRARARLRAKLSAAANEQDRNAVQEPTEPTNTSTPTTLSVSN